MKMNLMLEIQTVLLNPPPDERTDDDEPDYED